ncbi:MAG: MFS transporter [Prevotella sp.]|nr:MFS transporter [Prevotellaceae bacterium]MDY3365322.1 MFS transporter [Prevotella sp.]MDY3852236.1 MFS transporter [Prevotella sp.]
METTKQKGNGIAILMMIFLFAMISMVTNLAAPIGIIWKNQPALEGSNTLGMLGNMMNFLAYLFMGIPSGKLLTKIGYKKSALVAIAIGFTGMFVQYLSGVVLTESVWFGLPANFFVYLLGAFIAGVCVCMLNTVVNPMLNLLGGGGNRGNQLILIGGSANSLTGTLTPILVGMLIGEVTKNTTMVDVNLVLFIAMAIFAVSFIVLFATPIADPQASKAAGNSVDAHSPWNFRHFVLGAIAIFLYVGVEVGIPGTLLFFLSDTTANGAGLDPATAVNIAGFTAGTYWFLMLVGRFSAGFIADKVSSRTMMIAVNALGIVLIIAAMLVPTSVTTSMPIFTGSSFAMTVIPMSAVLLVLCGLCTSVMWSSIFNLATEGLGKYTAAASGIFMMMVVGGGVMPIIQNVIADKIGYMVSYIVPLLSIAFMLYYALFGSKNVNTDIPVE